MSKHKVQWIDGRRAPQCAPNPSYPLGIALNAAGDAERTCTVPLPYPAARIGAYYIKCRICGATAACTTAGRPDDPRSITIACKLEGAA